MGEVLLREGTVKDELTLLVADHQQGDAVLSCKAEGVSGAAAAAEEPGAALFGRGDAVELLDCGDADLLVLQVLDLRHELATANVDAAVALLRGDGRLGQPRWRIQSRARNSAPREFNRCTGAGPPSPFPSLPSGVGGAVAASSARRRSARRRSARPA